MTTCDHEEFMLPAGPNEDAAVCPECWMPVPAMRPEGETFGWHLSDCSLELRHRGACIGGGAGHGSPPKGHVVRG